MTKGPFNESKPRGQVRPMFADAQKCPECGTTLRTSLDVMLRVCDRELACRRRIRGDHETRSAL